MFGSDFLVSLRVGEDLVDGGVSLAALGLPAVGCQLNQEIVEIVGVVVDGAKNLGGESRFLQRCHKGHTTHANLLNN